MNILENGLSCLGFDEKKQKAVLPQLEAYVSELLLFNKVYDLVGTNSRDEIYTRHILDSLAPFTIIQTLVEERGFSEKIKPCFVDIGSGAGLPGIPLAICFPEFSFSLLERMSRRCAFLENVLSILQLENAQVLNTEAEKYTGEGFDFAVFRAFRPLDTKMTETILSLLKAEGLALAYKGKKDKIEREMKEIHALVGEDWKLKELTLPFLDSLERHLVIFKAVSN